LSKVKGVCEPFGPPNIMYIGKCLRNGFQQI
jgi:hypothetical protein